MGKLAILELEGDLKEEGLRITLEIYLEPANSDSRHRLTREKGGLPANPTLAVLLETWQESYRLIEKKSRHIEPKKITYTGTIYDLIESCQKSAEQLKQQFEEWLESSLFGKLNRSLHGELNKDEAIRLLIGTRDPLIQKLPWHYWDLIKHYPQAEVGFSAPDYRSRPPQSPDPPRQYWCDTSLRERFSNIFLRERLSDRVKILGILGYSAGIDTEKDKQLLQSLPNADVCLLDKPKLNQLTDQLWEKSWDIIFFAGHGKTTAENEGQIAINAIESISIDRVWFGLKKAIASGLQLAIFNSCDGLGLLARKLENDPQIPQMIIMRDLLPDRVAQAFLKYFLTAFSAGKPLYLAAREAREHLQGWENEYPCASWLPIIWQNPEAIPFAWPSSPLKRKPPKKPIAILCGILAAGLGSYWLLGHQGAVAMNQLGMASYRQDRLLRARRYYRIATLLDGNYAAPHYNLGWLCDEDLQNTDCAIRAHQQASLLGMASGSAELARLHILQGNYAKALAAIHRCLKQSKYPAVTAACLKNLGWIRWQQERWQEAEEALRKAIALEADSPHAHCLLAQVLQARGKPEEARKHWRISLPSLEYNVPEQDRCLALAKTRLQTQGEQ